MAEVLESSLVVPSDETPKTRLQLSNLDLVAVRKHTNNIYLYRNNNGDPDFFSVERVKSALAKALVLFYPYAGRLAVNGEGCLEIDCNAEGALLVVARSDLTLDDLKDFEPTPELAKQFIPVAESGEPPCILLMLQVTFLKCGGVVVGTGIHHVVMDGRCAIRFINTWASISRGDLTKARPQVHDRTLLRARNPPTILFNHTEYSQKVFTLVPTQCVKRTFKLSKNQINYLKSQCGGAAGAPVSTFRAVCAHVWRCTCLAQGLAPDTNTRLLFPVDICGRLQPPIPENYFGNSMIREAATAAVSDIISNPIQSVAERIKATIDRVNDEYVRSLIDHLELMDKRNMWPRGGMSDTDLRVVSILGIPVHDADFGWGAPQFFGRAEVVGDRVMILTKSPGEDGGVTVVIALDAKTMECFGKIFYEDLCE